MVSIIPFTHYRQKRLIFAVQNFHHTSRLSEILSTIEDQVRILSKIRGAIQELNWLKNLLGHDGKQNERLVPGYYSRPRFGKS